jgi:GT2 family glycosyltransferase
MKALTMPEKLPFVSVIITTYLSSTRPYLELAMESAKNLDYPKDRMEIILVTHKVDWRSYKEMFTNEYTRVICRPEVQFNNPQGMNYGINASKDETEFFYMFNDDVIVTKDSLKNLVRAVGDSPVIAHTITNCMNHNPGYYSLAFGIEIDGKWEPFNRQYYRLPDIAGLPKYMMNSRSIYPSGALFHQFLCLPCALFPKKVFDAIGTFDELFDAGCDDIDICLRATRAGIPVATALDAIAFHASGTSADSSMKLEARKNTMRYFHEKWGSYPPGATKESIDNLTEASYTRKVPGAV